MSAAASDAGSVSARSPRSSKGNDDQASAITRPTLSNDGFSSSVNTPRIPYVQVSLAALPEGEAMEGFEDDLTPTEKLALNERAIESTLEELGDASASDSTTGGLTQEVMARRKSFSFGAGHDDGTASPNSRSVQTSPVLSRPGRQLSVPNGHRRKKSSISLGRERRRSNASIASVAPDEVPTVATTTEDSPVTPTTQLDEVDPAVEQAEAAGADDDDDDFGDFDEFDEFEEGVMEDEDTAPAGRSEYDYDAAETYTEAVIPFPDLDDERDMLRAATAHLDRLFGPQQDDDEANAESDVPMFKTPDFGGSTSSATGAEAVAGKTADQSGSEAAAMDDEWPFMLTDRACSLWRQLTAPPALQPPDWRTSRIRRLFLVSVGIPVDLDEILPKVKHRKLVLPSQSKLRSRQESLALSMQARAVRGSMASTAAHVAAALEAGRRIAEARSTAGTSTSRATQTQATAGGRASGQQEIASLFDALATRQLSSTTTPELLRSMAPLDRATHLRLLADSTALAQLVLAEWQAKVARVKEEVDTFERVVENLVKFHQGHSQVSLAGASAASQGTGAASIASGGTGGGQSVQGNGRAQAAPRSAGSAIIGGGGGSAAIGGGNANTHAHASMDIARRGSLASGKAGVVLPGAQQSSTAASSNGASNAPKVGAATPGPGGATTEPAKKRTSRLFGR